MMRFNIQTKLFLLMVGVTAIILAGVLVAITMTVSEKIEQKIIGDFNKIQNHFLRQQSLIYDRLVESCYLIGENSTFKANVAIEDPTTVYQAVQEFSNFANVDLFIVTDADGKVLARLGEPGRFGDVLTNRGSVKRALNGIEPEIEPTWAELWAADTRLYQVATVPLYYNDDRIIGSISLGTQITRHEALALKGESNLDITMFSADFLLASTFGDSLGAAETDSLSAFLDRHRNLIDNVLKDMKPSTAFKSRLNRDNVYAFVSPLGEGAPAFYVATVNQASELLILDVLRQNIFLTAGISIIFTIILALVLGRTFSRPILRLVNGMNKVKDGDLSISLEPSTKDEIGLLTLTFNGMIIGLRERLHLMKYVGSHTIDMIKKSSHHDVSLGGERRELAVLFSDLRGFTAYSEHRTPEEVIFMLNRYLGYQADLVTEHNGSVDKFVGDEMVALFIGKEAIERAVDCAIAIQRLVKKVHEKDPAPVYIGIGINYGPVILGNMGAIERMDYTVIGAAVNLGARLCSAADPGQILIRKDLLNGLGKNYTTGQSRMMSFKGFSNEIEIVSIM
jgi:class 3 adenylate cyclase